MISKVFSKLKKWGNKMFNRKNIIEQVVNSEIRLPNYTRLEKWKSIYSGEYKGFKEVDSFNIQSGQHKRDRHQLNMSKVVASELAKLVFTEKVEINVDDELVELKDYLLDNNRFYKEFKDKVEIMLALGGYVLKANPELLFDGSYRINLLFISPENFIPISWENGQVTEAAFLNVTKKGKKVYVLVESHKWEVRDSEDEVNEQGEPTKKRVIVIKNELFETDEMPTRNNSVLNQNLVPVPLNTLDDYSELEPELIIENIGTSLFRYIKAPGVNNFDIESPFGISVFANAEDTLLALNIAFDSFIREFQLGKRRIIVPAESARTFIDQETKTPIRYFDASDEAYVAFKYSDPDKQKITDNTVEIRVEDHLKAINGMLDLLAMQTGLSAGTFTFDGTSVKTATEVISENSKTYQTVKDICNIIEENLVGIVDVMMRLAWMYDVTDIEIPDDVEIKVNWDDSVIGDKYTDADYYIKLNMNGIISKRAIMRRQLNMTEEQIDEMFEEIRREQSFAPMVDELLLPEQPPIVKPPVPTGGQ